MSHVLYLNLLEFCNGQQVEKKKIWEKEREKYISLWGRPIHQITLRKERSSQCCFTQWLVLPVHLSLIWDQLYSL